MLLLLLVSCTLKLVSSKTTCNHFQQWPVRFCTTVAGGSTQYVCSSGVPFKKTYATSNCSDTAITTTYMGIYSPHKGYQWSCDEDLDPCDYAVVETTVYTNDCDEEMTKTRDAYIVRECFVVGSLGAKYKCDGTDLKYSQWLYSDIDDPCDGSTHATHTYESHACQNGEEVHYCGKGSARTNGTAAIRALLSVAFCFLFFLLH